MAQPTTLGAQTFDTTAGMVPSFQFTTPLVRGYGAALPTTVGDPTAAGVPATDIVGSYGATTASATAYGAATARKSPVQQPILWLVVLLVLGVILIGHTARISTRG